LHHQLAKIYEKYQEATDALRHERLGRRHAEAVLERVNVILVSFDRAFP
jgi:hypothetical protein